MWALIELVAHTAFVLGWYFALRWCLRQIKHGRIEDEGGLVLCARCRAVPWLCGCKR